MRKVLLMTSMSIALVGCAFEYDECWDHPHHDWDGDVDEHIDEGFGDPDGGPRPDSGSDGGVTPDVGDNECSEVSDCPSGETCAGGECVPEQDTCQFNYECGAGRQCINNECASICQTNDECGAHQECIDSRCVAPTMACSGAADCGDLDCLNGECVALCSADDDCGDTEFCDSGVCRLDWRPAPFCSSDDDCATDHVCVDGACRTPCASGENVECQTFDSQLPICAEDLLCYSLNETNPECRSAEECQSGQACVDGICR